MAVLAACDSVLFGFRGKQKTYDVFGLHDCPAPGGSPLTDKAVNDIKRLGAKILFSWDPDEELIGKMTSAGIQVVARGALSSREIKDNRYARNSLLSLLYRMNKYIPAPVIQPFNEVNSLEETGDIRLPEDHIKNDFLPAADLISKFNGLTLITPVAQRNDNTGISDVEYFSRMVDSLRKNSDVNWIKENLGLGIHAYTFKVDENPWEWILNLDNIVLDKLGVKLPIYVTEAGLHQDETRQFRQDEIADATKRILTSPMPDDRLKAFCFWLYANEAQKNPNYPMPPVFELNAWVKPDGDTLVATSVQEFNLGKFSA